MIEIKNNVLKINEIAKPVKDINIIKVVKDSVCLSNRMVDSVECDCKIEDLYQKFIDAKLNNFVLSNNTIINLENIKSLYIKNYQYAGISIYQCEKEHAELCLLVFVCKNGRNEIMPFSTFKEAEHWYHEIDTLITDYKNKEVIKGLMQNC